MYIYICIYIYIYIFYSARAHSAGPCYSPNASKLRLKMYRMIRKSSPEWLRFGRSTAIQIGTKSARMKPQRVQNRTPEGPKWRPRAQDGSQEGAKGHPKNL